MNKKIFGIIICFLTLTPITTNALPKVETKTFDNNKYNPNVIYDNIEFIAYSTLPISILDVIIWRIPVPLMQISITNLNEIPITLKRNFKLVATMGEDKLLTEFRFDSPKKLQPYSEAAIMLFTQYEFKEWDYIFGPFDCYVDIDVPETNTDVTVVFHGFVFCVGQIIFNKGGDIVE